jgi:hypothetical protein
MHTQYDSEMIWWDFGHLGWPGWTPVTVLEMRILFDGAERVMQNNSPDVCMIWIQDRKNMLLNQAITQGISPYWISQALLVTAVSGLLGYQIPDVLWPDD